LTATRLPSESRARNTLPVPPPPISRMMRYGPMAVDESPRWTTRCPGGRHGEHEIAAKGCDVGV
jgi:hypothetical protein